MPLAPSTDHGTSTAHVSALLAAQAPMLAELPVTWLADGWDNSTYRLGERLLVRLPRHDAAGELLTNEVEWLPVLGQSLVTATPQPVFVGSPNEQFPRAWSVVEFIPGREASEIPVAERATFAEDLADFLWSLHVPAPAHAPVNPLRGGSLANELADARVRERLAALPTEDAPLAEALLVRWKAWVDAPEFDGVNAWLHGDLHPHNLVVGDDGRLAGVIDWGDLTAGDPACDLATAWLTFDEPGRRAFTERVDQGGPIDAALWARAKSWALHLALAMVSQPDGPSRVAHTGRHALRQLAAEAV